MNLLNTVGGGGEKLVQVERTERAGWGHTGERGAQQSGSGGSRARCIQMGAAVGNLTGAPVHLVNQRSLSSH